jgi:hypothetical protein
MCNALVFGSAKASTAALDSLASCLTSSRSGTARFVAGVICIATFRRLTACADGDRYKKDKGLKVIWQ